VQEYTPTTSYYSDLTPSNFKLRFNFEEGLNFKILSGDTSIIIEKDKSKVISGDNSGAIYLRLPQRWSESISTNSFSFPSFPCFLELDYMGTIPFQIGIDAENFEGKIFGEYLTGFFPKSTPTKIYIDLSSFLNKAKSYSKFYIKVRSSLEDFGDQYKEGYVIIDNIKVIAR
jgi:hypothetical protein